MINHIRAMITAAVEGIGVALVPSYSVLLPEGRFRIYQKKAKSSLAKHRALVTYLQSVNPAEFGSDAG